MEMSTPPSLEELQICRWNLLKDIQEAENLFDPLSPELCTLKSGLKHLEEKIAELRVIANQKVILVRILAVLGNDDTVNQVRASLSGCYRRLSSVNSFSEAMEILRSDEVNLIISDMRVQDDESDYSSVFDFLRWVKGDPHLRSIPFVCLSLEPSDKQVFSDSLRIAARGLGAARYLTMQTFDESLFRNEIDWLLPFSS